jgi:hypothetical protein
MWFTCGFATRPLNGVNLILAGYCIPFNINKLLSNGKKSPFGMHPTHNSSSEVELEFCKRIIRNGLKQQKCQAYYTITRSGTAYFICIGPRQFLTGTPQAADQRPTVRSQTPALRRAHRKRQHSKLSATRAHDH